MALLTYSDFIDDVMIAGLEEPATQNTVTRYINTYEPEFLKKVLGLDLYALYATGIAVTPTPDAIWTDLRDGKTYTYSGRQVEFKGLKYPAARYVYYHYMRSFGFTKTTPAGQVKSEKGDASILTPTHKMVNAWNQMARAVDGLWDYLNDYRVSDDLVYPDWNRNQIDFRHFRTINDMGI